MKKRALGDILVITALTIATMQLLGCGGGGGGGGSSVPTLSTDQTAFESFYLSPASSYSPSWTLPLIGVPINGTHNFYAHPTSVLASPLTNGAQKTINGANINLTNALSIPEINSVDRYLISGQIITDAGGSERVSYQGASVKEEYIAATGATLTNHIRSAIKSLPLSGLVVNSPADLAHWFNALFTNPNLLAGSAIWGSGSAYLEYTSTNTADSYRVFDFSTSTTGTSPSPVATGTTIAALMASGGITSPSDAVTYTMANGSVSVVNGIRTFVASIPRPKVTSNLYRTYYEVNGNVLTGDLLKAGEVLGGSAYQQTIAGVTSVNYSAKYQVRINQATVNSIKAAVTF